MSAIADVLWPGMKALESGSELGGIYANKRGYHNKRQNLPTSDYSIAQFAVDREGPSNEAAAIDWTFPDAQSGKYGTISKYSKRLLAAGRAGRNADPRTVYMREFFGNADSDKEVEGWDYAKAKVSTSDTSHLWHIHISIHRKYVNDRKAMDAVLSILKGESVSAWLARWSRDVTFEAFSADLPVLKQGDNDDSQIYKNSEVEWVRRVQRQLQTPADGDYGPVTAAAIKAQVPNANGTTVDIGEYIKLYGMWGAKVTSRPTVQGAHRLITNVNFTGELPILQYGDSDDNDGITGTGAAYVTRAQRALSVDDDGEYGPATAAAVKALGFGDGHKVDLPVWSHLFGLWGYTKTGTKVVAR